MRIWILGVVFGLLGLALHLLFDWSAGLLAPLLYALFVGPGGWWRGGLLSLCIWGCLLGYNEWFFPEEMERLRMVVSALLDGRLPPWGVPLLALGSAFLLGAVAGRAGTALHEVLARPRLP
jgi:hypothetical protein|nr:MAG: hypothetical protein KatS3mg041_1711 [Bacteroidota bacterium]